VLLQWACLDRAEVAGQIPQSLRVGGVHPALGAHINLGTTTRRFELD
jgi:hypothetical protein